jgi:hypothetical protein
VFLWGFFFSKRNKKEQREIERDGQTIKEKGNKQRKDIILYFMW